MFHSFKSMGIVATFCFVAIFFGPAYSESIAPQDVAFNLNQKKIATSLTDVEGDPVKGRELAINRKKGNCLACHAMPIPEQSFQGSVGPSLWGIGETYSLAELRLRVVDYKQLNAQSTMPAFYRDPSELERPLKAFKGKTILAAQEVEDLIAYLATLKKSQPVISKASVGEEISWGKFEVGDRRSGYTFRKAETRAAQDDEFENPGMFAYNDGEALWDKVEGNKGKSCASCHGDAAESMKGVGNTYPKFYAPINKLQNLEQRINLCRTENMGAKGHKYESPELLATTIFVKRQSLDLPMSVAVDGPSAPFFEKGKELYYQPIGQLQMSCANCHEEHEGKMIRADQLSQGQSNGFPTYRFKWQGVGSLHRRFRGCNTNIRATKLSYGSDAYNNLELFVAWRGRGLPVETPSVRN